MKNFILKLRGKIPVTWNIDNVKSLEYEFGSYNSCPPIDVFVNAGHDEKNIKIWKYQQPKTLPVDISELHKNWPFLNNVGTAINFFQPGQYMPWHHDEYDRYRKFIDNDTSDIVRIIIMLEDSSPGQIIQVNESTYGTWKAGDWFAWADSDYHAFYNFSTVNRYAVQITATL